MVNESAPVLIIIILTRSPPMPPVPYKLSRSAPTIPVTRVPCHPSESPPPAVPSHSTVCWRWPKKSLLPVNDAPVASSTAKPLSIIAVYVCL